YEIERLTRLGEGDKANISIDSHVLRLKASTSGPLNKHSEKTENFHAVISTPRAFKEDVASPVELAKARSRGKLIFIQRRHLNRLSVLGNLKGQMEARGYLFVLLHTFV
nr:hypothetical protein [Tanacetum cinerariifolium]